MNKLTEYWTNELLIGSVWINNADFTVKILDYGNNDVWLYYFDNKNKTSWEIEKFLKEYRPSFKEPTQ